jgi:GR25 family glycosyltransferase involved in LPS biosynthesis
VTERICIVAVGYNRPKSMQRLLDSIGSGNYLGEQVDLLVSIDKGKTQGEIVEIANHFEWKHGGKRIRAFEERQGLRSHIIQCGDLTNEYRAVVILEDDITVSENFYAYVKQTLDAYEQDDRVAGISLYKHHVNVGVNHFFEPEFIGYDVFMMQFAQSWGQCWTKSMWDGFKTWYNQNEDYYVNDYHDFKSIPDNILHWGNQSWMKYYMAYLAETHKYYVYPYYSLSTNHSEVGEHNNTANADWQVAMLREYMDYHLPEFENAVKYDIFFEREDYMVSGYEDKRCIIDLYGIKKDYSEGDILVSTAARPYKIIETRQLKYRPHELNCRYGTSGEGIYIYDLYTSDNPPKRNKTIRTKYDVRAIEWKKLIHLGVLVLMRKIKNKILK